MFNFSDKIAFKLIKIRFEFSKAFIKDTRQAHKYAADLFVRSSFKRNFEFLPHILNHPICIPLLKAAWRVELYERVLKFQDFSDDYLNINFWQFIFALNNVAIYEEVIDSLMHLKKRLCYRLRCFRDTKKSIFLQVNQLCNLSTVGLQECQVRLDARPIKTVCSSEFFHKYI